MRSSAVPKSGRWSRSRWTLCRGRRKVHLIRNKFRLACRKDLDALKKGLRPTYTAPTAEAELEELEKKWGGQYRAIVKLRRNA